MLYKIENIEVLIDMKCKLIILLIFSVFTFFRVYSQPGCPSIDAGPDQSLNCNTPCASLTATVLAPGATTGYTVTQIPYTPPATFNSGNAILVNTDDLWSSVVTLPFNFCFYGNVYSSVVIGSNEIISFDVTANAPGGYCAWSLTSGTTLPTSTFPMCSIMGPYQDVDPTYQGNIYEELIGTSPCRMLVVSFYHIPYFGDPNSVSTSQCGGPLFATSQMVLYESTNIIEIYILNKESCSGWNDGLAIEGIQDATGANAVVVPGRNNTVWTASNDAWRFTPNGPTNYSFSWFQGTTLIDSTATINVCPSATTTYTAQVVYNLCSGSPLTLTDDAIVNVNNSIGLNITPQNPVVCGGGSTTLTANTTNPSATFNWSTGPTTPSITVSPTITTTYTVTATTPGCTTQASVTVMVNPIPTVSISASANHICAGDSTTLTASGANSYMWGSGDTTSSITVSPGITTTYTVTGDANGCTGTANIIITLNPNPAITITPSANPICLGASPTLTAGGASTYLWSSGLGTANPITVSPATTTTYSVTGTDANGCTGTTGITVTVSPNPTVSITASVNPICAGNQTILTGSGATTYSWNNGLGTINPATATPTVTTTYTVTGTDANGCTGTANIIVTVNPNIALTVSSTNAFCGHAGTATVNASGGLGNYTYLWSNGQTTPTATGLTQGIYTVTVSDTQCSNTASVNVLETSGPIAGFSEYPRITTLLDGLVTFTDNSIGNIVNWSWSFGDGCSGTGSTIQHQYTSLDTYLVTLIVTDNKGCIDTITDTLLVKDYFTFYIPNAFTPNNGSEMNTLFYPFGTNVDPDDFNMMIFDRWGGLVFNTSKWDVSAHHSEGWNGTVNNTGTKVYMDVYVYRILVKEIHGKEHKYFGSVTLIP